MARSGIIFIANPPLLTDFQIEVLAEILANVGIAFFASIVLPLFIGSLDAIKFVMIGFSLISSIGFWILALIVARRRSI